MNREQMVAWLAIEGWEPVARQRDRSDTPTQSILRGSTRIHNNGSVIIDSTWTNNNVVRKSVSPISWEELVNVEVYYEKARML